MDFDSLKTISEKPVKPYAHHLCSETFSESTFPLDGLSQSVKEYIRTVAEAYGCPLDYVAAACFITAGIAAGKKVKLETNPFTNYPCDFVCIVGKPSSNKTGPLKEVTQPLRNRDKSKFKEYKKEKAEYDKSKQKGGSNTGERPVFHQLVIGDSSPEARNVLLAQGEMVLIIADELKFLIDSLGRYVKDGNGSGTEVSQFLSIWSNVSVPINRKSEEPKMVDDPAMSIIGGIQPGLLGKTFGVNKLMSSGFIQRFLFVYPDKAPFVKRKNRKLMTPEIRKSWTLFVNQLFGMEQLTLQLSQETKDLYDEYADANDMKADSEQSEYVGIVMQKMEIHVLRLAIMAHLLSDHWNEPIISSEAMSYAIRIANYFTRTHVECIYPLLIGAARQGEKRLTKELVIKEIGQVFDVKNKSALAEALGYDRAKLTNILNGKI